MKWKTSISTHVNGELVVYGKKLSTLIQKHSFVEGIFLMLTGKIPEKNQKELLNTMLIAMLEHGVEAPSSFVSRTVVSTGNSMNTALAAGILAVGDYHGGAIEQCAFLLQSGKNAKTIVNGLIKENKRMPGFGHKLYKDKDPRAQLLLEKAETLNLKGKFVTLIKNIQTELQSQTGKMLPINIDGAIAALMLELGFSWRLGKALFILGRLPGLIAHTHEELVNEKPYRRLEEQDVEYTGKSSKQ